MKIRVLFISFIFQFTYSFSQRITDGNCCDKAILISDTIQVIQLPPSKGTTWYKFKAVSSEISIKLYTSGNYIIYNSTNSNCPGNENVIFAMGDSLINSDDEYLHFKASEFLGQCSCNVCRKSPSLKKIRTLSENYYCIAVINTTQPFELRFDKDKMSSTSTIKKNNSEVKTSCEIGFVKSYTYGMISKSDSLKNKPYNKEEWTILRYGIHIYYIKRDIQDHFFKIRDYSLDVGNSKCVLDSLVNYLTVNTDKKILVTGYVTKGEDKLAEKYEVKASEALANIVRNYLYDHKIALNRIQTEGKGSSQQLYKNEKSKIGYMYEMNRNNRVEIKVIQ